MSLALEQARLAPAQPWGCAGARDIILPYHPILLQRKAQFIGLGRTQTKIFECFRESQTCTKSWLPFRVAFAPFFLKGNLPFSGTGKCPVSMGSLTISTESSV